MEYEPESEFIAYQRFDDIMSNTQPPELHPALRYLRDLDNYRPLSTYRASECYILLQPPRPLDAGEICVYDVKEKKVVIEKHFDELTAKDMTEHRELCEKAIMKELESFIVHDCFELIAKSEAINNLTTRFVLRWKLINGVRDIKARLVAHGFKDHDSQSLQVYASTTTRWGQRLICSIAASRRWELISADISTAFLQGVTFKELSELTGEPLRTVSLSPPKGYEKFFNKLKGLEKADFSSQCLSLKKPAYGLKDAPRAWRKRLHLMLTNFQGRSLSSDESIYAFFSPKQELLAVLSAHVDDLKIAGDHAFVKGMLTFFETQVGKLKVERAFKSAFDHCGIRHTQSENYSITLSQAHYAANLRPVDTSQIDLTRTSDPLTPELIELYLSLLGGLSWLLLTRPDIAIYVQALQRASKAPAIEHLIRLNKVCRWCRSRECVLHYSSALDVTQPLKMLGVGDSAFRKESDTGLAMRGAFVMLCQKSTEHPGGVCHILDYFSRRQKRVTRSTFASELLNMSDTTDATKQIAFAVAEVSFPYSLKDLAQFEEHGNLPVDIEICVDARGVYDSLVNEQTRCSEGGLVMTLLSLKENIRKGIVKRVWWVDTRDMLADGLTKGLCSRRAILQLCRTGQWVLQHPCLSYQHPLVAKSE